MNEKVEHIVHKILINQLMVKPEKFDWNARLNDLNEEFEFLEYLVYFEQLLTKHFDSNIPLLENIITDFHSPTDIVDLIKNELTKQT